MDTHCLAIVVYIKVEKNKDLNKNIFLSYFMLTSLREELRLGESLFVGSLL